MTPPPHTCSGQGLLIDPMGLGQFL
jgi:hypothetical protein